MNVRRPLRAAFALLATLTATGLLVGYAGSDTATGADGKAVASAWSVVKYPQGQPGCVNASAFRGSYFERIDCGHGDVRVSGTTSSSQVTVDFYGDGSTTPFHTATATFVSGVWRFAIRPTATWPSGEVTTRVKVAGVEAEGHNIFFHNQLGAGIAADSRAAGYRPGDEIPVSGTLFKQKSLLLDTEKTPVAGTYSLRVVTATGEVRGPYGPFTANEGGAGGIRATLPAAATAGLTATADTNFETTVSVELVDAAWNDDVTGAWRTRRATAGTVTLTAAPQTLVVENSFVSAVGWVKPGESYPFRVFVRNYTSQTRTGAVVTVPPPDGVTFAAVAPTSGSGSAEIRRDGSIRWTVGDVPARTDGGPGLKTLVVGARADTLQQDPQIVWKDLSSTATLTYTGGPAGLTDRSHGPKVIPPKASFDTARYGDRPFPVVPVDYTDRKHELAHSGERLAATINSGDLSGSTFNLFQEMSYRQLFPHGTVPSAALATGSWNVAWKSPHRQASGWDFSDPFPLGACVGTTTGAAPDNPLNPERIKNGWYQLPGDTNYYGGDPSNVVLINAFRVTGQPVVLTAAQLFIDSACGPIAKAVYDAAHIADPEIDYSDYDTDKDGVVDFFMMVYVGAGGNGVSQSQVPPYDNIWPHSFSLEFQFEDPETGLKGYISDDQLRDHQGRPLYYTSEARQQMTLQQTPYPVYVRVGPYNVNPETAIEKASVISQEYGHSLGLPDFYSGGGRVTYGDWNLMATDKSQHMDVFAKQELGWLVPRVLKPGEQTVAGWRDSKADTNRIDWVQPNGTPYTLTGPNVHNGEAYVTKLPGRRLIDPAKVAAGASPDHVWWSQMGDDFNCPPAEGHNLDIFLPELATLPEGTPVKLTFKSYWDIEWDFDYGFVTFSPDGGETYTGLRSQKGYTTAANEFNPNAVSCLNQFGHGITGTSGSYAAGTQNVDRLLVVDNYPDGGFLLDEYDLTQFAGKGTAPVLRFSYMTDPAVIHPGWFIDDVKVTAGGQVIYESNFENGEDEPRVYNGGCKDALAVAKSCTAGWQYVSASQGSPADHAYYLEMRDRSGFDESGKGQNDRSPIAFMPGLLLVYTDENHGYGNVGVGDPPAQNPLDATPQPGNRAPNLDDAAFTAAGVGAFSDSGSGWVDNYTDPSRPDNRWRFDFGCLTFQVLTMSGDDVGPSTAPGNLQGDVKLTLGTGCASYDYGFGVKAQNFAPTAVAAAKPTEARVGQKVRFDGSASSDDLDTSRQLTYAWDLDGDGTFETSGATARRSYDAAGTYVATLKVTDTGNKTDTDSVTITVS